MFFFLSMDQTATNMKSLFCRVKSCNLSILQVTFPDSWKHYRKLVQVCTAHFFSDRFSLKWYSKGPLIEFWCLSLFSQAQKAPWIKQILKQLQDFSYHPTIFVIRGPFRCVWRLSLKDFGLMVSIWGQGKDVGFSWDGQSSPPRVVRMVCAR